MPRTTLPAPSTMPWPDHPETGKYLHFSGDERTNPGLVEEACRIHAEGYLAAGFLRDEAPLDLSRISTAWSTSQSCDARYYVAVNPSNPADRATARQLRPRPGRDYRSLPGIGLCADVLSAAGTALLEAAAARGSIIEISGLARSTGGTPYAVHELIRWMLHHADDAETWVFAIIVETLQSLRKSYGHGVFQVLGGEVALREYGGISVDVTLTPVLWRPAGVIPTLRGEALSTPDGPQRRRLLRTLAFLQVGAPSRGNHRG